MWMSLNYLLYFTKNFAIQQRLVASESYSFQLLFLSSDSHTTNDTVQKGKKAILLVVVYKLVEYFILHKDYNSLSFNQTCLLFFDQLTSAFRMSGNTGKQDGAMAMDAEGQ